MARAVVDVPKTSRRGEGVEIEPLLPHPAETGFGRGL